MLAERKDIAEQLKRDYKALSKVLQAEHLIYDAVSEHIGCGDPFEDVVYVRLDGICRNNDEDVDNRIKEMQGVLYSLHAMNTKFAIMYYFSGSSLEVYLGLERTEYEKVLEVFRGCYGVACKEKESFKPLLLSENEVYKDSSMKLFGFVKGNLEKREDLSKSVIDSVMAGAFKKKFAIIIVAKPILKEDSRAIAERWSEICAKCEMTQSEQKSGTDGINTTSYEAKESLILEYNKLAEKYYTLAAKGAACGAWDTSVKIYAEQEETADSVVGIIAANSSNPETLPESVRQIKVRGRAQHQIGYDVYIYRYQGQRLVMNDLNGEIYDALTNYYTSDELATIAELPCQDMFGFSVKDNVNFDVSRDIRKGISLGNIIYNGQITDNEYYVDPNELIRHSVVVGLTGSGKTNSVKSLLVSLHNQPKSISCMIIEPAKSEYWELYNLGFEDLNIYTTESVANRLYINPFECEKVNGKRVSIQTHIDHVFAAFKASFIMYTPMPYVLEKAIYAIYEDCGWDISADTNPYGEIYPTIEHLYWKIPIIVDVMGYGERMKDELISSLQSRINSLRIGLKGNMLNVKKSSRIEELFEKNTVIELDGIGDDEVKAFIISMILIKLKEYRSQQEDSQKAIKHFLLIEEAHRLLKNVSSGTGESADPRGNAVEFFCNLLAELRSKGQAFLIADQIPTKLAPDVVDNTNLKIIHRLVTEKERDLMGRATHMTPEQIDYISTFTQGVAAVYSEGDVHPKLVKAKYAGVYKTSDWLHDEVYSRCIDRTQQKFINNAMVKAEGVCRQCPYAYICDYSFKGNMKKKIPNYQDLYKDEERETVEKDDIVSVRKFIEFVLPKYKGFHPRMENLAQECTCLAFNIFEKKMTSYERYLGQCVDFLRREFFEN